MSAALKEAVRLNPIQQFVQSRTQAVSDAAMIKPFEDYAGEVSKAICEVFEYLDSHQLALGMLAVEKIKKPLLKILPQIPEPIRTEHIITTLGTRVKITFEGDKPVEACLA